MDGRKWTDAEIASAGAGNNDAINAKRLPEFVTHEDLQEALYRVRLDLTGGDIARQTVDRSGPMGSVSMASTLGNSASNQTRTEPREMTALETAVIEMDEILTVLSDTAARLGDFNDRVSGPQPEAVGCDESSGAGCTIGYLFTRIASMRQLACRLSGEVYRTQKIG